MSDVRGSSRRPGLYLVCLLYLSCAPSASAYGRVECNTVPSKILDRGVPYCIVLPASFDTDKAKRFSILYELHGLGDNEQFLVHSGLWNLVEDLWEGSSKLKEFLIATPAGGASFYINSKDGKVRYEAFLLQEFFPFMEKRYRVSPGRANRAISGVSMGGYGALHLAFGHPQLFSAVSAHSAALIEKLPAFVNAPESPRARVLGGVFGSPPDTAFWDAHSPLVLARSANLSGMKIYFDCGDQDDFGFEAGAAALDRILTARRIPHEFHIYPGRHDPAYFAAHIPASLAFHSELFP